MRVRRLHTPTPAQRAAIVALDTEYIDNGACAPDDDDFADPAQAWWGVFSDGEMVGYASACKCPDGAVKLTRAVVSRVARGHGLQQRLIRARVRWAESIGASRVWTYTHLTNVRSAGNLCKAGFHYRGATEDRHWLYWRHETQV